MRNLIDLRSDTVTRPGIAMRQAMAAAEVGDDVYDDDSTTLELQSRAARMLGKEAALFVPSGTMANSIAIKVQTQPGDEILLDGNAHSMYYELGLPAVISAVLTRQFASESGIPDVDSIKNNIHTENLHTPGTSLIVLENTHNRAGGAIIPVTVLRSIKSLAEDRHLHVHLDGARLFNASVATGVPPSDIASCADTVTFCLSKGLGCPVGSVLCGSAEFIAKAKRIRKMLGGGMRQTGILAAAGMYALEHNINRLADDHRRARELYAGLTDVTGVSLDRDEPQTNMVYFNTHTSADEVCDRLRDDYSLLCSAMGSHRIRLVTHLDIDDKAVGAAIAAISDCLS